MVDLDAFVADGYVKVERTVPRSVADAARAALWQQMRLSPHAPQDWSAPVVWTGDMTGARPFGELVRSSRVSAALDLICGRGGWLPRGALGNIPVRFPVTPAHDDRGWHIDANTALPDGSWAVTGRPHTVLLLTLLSDVSVHDAPTRLRKGSHHDVAGVLGADPVDFADMGRLVDEVSSDRPVTHATGEPGDVYVVHPFTVHAADEHRGREPRFMAQSPVMLTSPVAPGEASPLAQVFAC